jgi:hypothetical protein
VRRWNDDRSWRRRFFLRRMRNHRYIDNGFFGRCGSGHRRWRRWMHRCGGWRYRHDRNGYRRSRRGSSSSGRWRRGRRNFNRWLRSGRRYRCRRLRFWRWRCHRCGRFFHRRWGRRRFHFRSRQWYRFFNRCNRCSRCGFGYLRCDGLWGRLRRRCRLCRFGRRFGFLSFLECRFFLNRRCGQNMSRRADIPDQLRRRLRFHRHGGDGCRRGRRLHLRRRGGYGWRRRRMRRRHSMRCGNKRFRFIRRRRQRGVAVLIQPVQRIEVQLNGGGLGVIC